jgi:hypothetical protein
MCGSNAYRSLSMTYVGYEKQPIILTSYAYGSGGSVYWGADISPKSKGCCSEARIVEAEREVRMTVDSVNVKVPRIVPAPYAIDTFKGQVLCQTSNKVL